MNASDKPEHHRVYIGLGSNVSPEDYLPRAICLLREYTTLVAVSPVWETPPYGMTGANFLNASALAETDYSAVTLKTLVLRRIEAMLGRVRGPDKFAPRTIDLDILVFDGETVDSEIWDQPHLAVPLAALIPGLIHPQRGEALQSVATRLLSKSSTLKPRPDIVLRTC